MGWNDHIDVSDIEMEIRMEMAERLGLEDLPECDHPERALGKHSKDCKKCQFDAWVYDLALKKYMTI